MAEAPFEVDKAHRWFGIDLNNSTMDALDAGLVTPETCEPYIHAVHASCYHWMQVGLIESNPDEVEDWDKAFAIDSLARAYAAAGDMEAAREAKSRAQAAGEAIFDEEDRDIFLRWFRSGNWHGL